MDQGQQQPGYEPPSQQDYPPQGYVLAQGYAPPQQVGYGIPPGQQQYAGGPPPQGYGPPQVGYAPPQQGNVSQGYAPSQQGNPSQGYAPPQQGYPSQGYGPPQVDYTSPVSMQQTDAGIPGKTGLAPPQGTELNYSPSPPDPPPPYEPSAPQQIPGQHFSQSMFINDDEARDALLAYIAQNCCYGKKAAKDMDIKDITPSSTYHYNFVSFCESRTTILSIDAYCGGEIDGPQNGQPPQPWDIVAGPDKMFTPQTKRIAVPHTDTVEPCSQCMASGITRCSSCRGGGMDSCGFCQGSGFRVEHRGGHQQRTYCHSCNGAGRKTCGSCGGNGRHTCHVCDGQGRIKIHVVLKIKWECYTDNHVTEKANVPGRLILGSRGTDIFTQELPRVYPITAFHDQDVNHASQALVDRHSRNWPSKRILMQRHTLRAVPVSEVKYEWKDTNTRYWVYGLDHKVYAPDYPQQYCWGCTLI